MDVRSRLFAIVARLVPFVDVRSSLREMKAVHDEARDAREDRGTVPPRDDRDFSTTLHPPYWKHGKDRA